MMLVLAKVVDQIDGLRRNVRELNRTGVPKWWTELAAAQTAGRSGGLQSAGGEARTTASSEDFNGEYLF